MKLSRFGIHAQFLSIVAILFMILLSCKKEDNTINKYGGVWNFEVHISSSSIDTSFVPVDTTKYFTGTIGTGEDSQIVIHYLETSSVALTVDNEGILSNFPTQYCNGEFTDENNLDLFLRWGGLGGGTSHSIKGTR